MMRTVVPIILFVAVAGFHNVVSVYLDSAESNKSSEEMDATTWALTGTTGNQEENTASQTAETTNTMGYKHKEEDEENVERGTKSLYLDEERAYYGC
ncbi:uncharacterized protein si:dkey-200l5.4 isoform X1 [Triplophysa dalaica]|uniref:uncharacterized protein si:dkey-200l5.4 isoform X1 n=1 Tax=Triplophysa dalaica TaxID=1582913 RepID=UPI0024DF9E5F|nr:uncharacterized protein si:dkey-200l5.4 isoform X1 [Triplophysa dalaica]